MNIAVSILTVYLMINFVNKFPKMFICLGLVVKGASWQLEHFAESQTRNGNKYL